MDLTSAKRRLRRELAALAPPSESEARAASEAVAARLLGDTAVAAADRVALYVALPDEVPSQPLFDALSRSGRTCLLPRTLASRTLRFAVVTSLAGLAPGPHGVPEPRGSDDLPLGRADVVLVPGLAFDRAGVRLGRGAGCYDRTFPPGGRDQPRLIGVSFASRIVASLPADSHDRRMDAIVTERELRWMRESG